MRIILSLSLLALLSGPCWVSAADRFEQWKLTVSEAACVNLEFLSVLTSDVFESVDTADGAACIASDGRFYVRIGGEEYLRAMGELWVYSEANNQITVEPADDSEELAHVSFILRLDDYYGTRTIVPNVEYSLLLKEDKGDSLPDSVRVYMDRESGLVDRIEYRDINEDLNQIIFNSVSPESECESTRFTPAFPDSVEVVRLF
jgi:outer membrane lipoprotein-sorting protein